MSNKFNRLLGGIMAAAVALTAVSPVNVFAGADLEENTSVFDPETVMWTNDPVENVLAEDGVSGANTAAFLPAEEVRLCAECETGFQTVPLAFGEEFTVGGLFFRYESPSKLLLLAEGCAVEFDFEGAEALGADLFVGEAGAHTERLNYFLKDAIIKEL